MALVAHIKTIRDALSARVPHSIPRRTGVEVEALEFMQPNDLHGTVRVIFIQSVDGIMLRQSLS